MMLMKILLYTTRAVCGGFGRGGWGGCFFNDGGGVEATNDPASEGERKRIGKWKDWLRKKPTHQKWQRCYGWMTQLVERCSTNPMVVSSIPTL